MPSLRLPLRAAMAVLVALWLASPASGAADATAGLPNGVTPDGHFYLGRADAPVTLVEYGDFL